MVLVVWKYFWILISYCGGLVIGFGNRCGKFKGLRDLFFEWIWFRELKDILNYIGKCKCYWKLDFSILFLKVGLIVV